MVGYNLFKIKDSYTLEVLAACTANFYYVDNGVDVFIDSYELDADDSVSLLTGKDGGYKVVLIEPITLVETLIEFRITYHLEKSIASDAYYILVKHDYDSGCKPYKENCTGREDRKVLKSREIFVKLFTYKFKYLPSIGFNTNLAFDNYTTKAMDAYKCNVQAKINKILIDECNGNHTSSNKLFELYLAIFWAGLYFIGKANANGEDELRYVEEKFYYNYINVILCDFSITLKELEDIYNNVP